MDDLFAYLWDAMNHYGFDQVYTITVIVNLVILSYWKDIKNWSKLALWNKSFIVSAVLGGGIMNLFCLLRLVGVFKF